MTNEDLHDATNAGLERACGGRGRGARPARARGAMRAEREADIASRRRRERETRDALRADANARRDDDKSFRAREKRKRDRDSRAGAARTGSRRRNARPRSRGSAEDRGSTDEPHTREPTTVPGKAHDATRTNVRNEPTVARRVMGDKTRLAARSSRNARAPFGRRLSVRHPLTRFGVVATIVAARRNDAILGRGDVKPGRGDVKPGRGGAALGARDIIFDFPTAAPAGGVASSSPTAKRASVSVASARLRSAESLSFNSTFCTGSARCAETMATSARRRSRSSRRAARAAAADSNPGPDPIATAPLPLSRRGARAPDASTRASTSAMFPAAPPRRDPSESSSIECSIASEATADSFSVLLADEPRTLSLSGFFRLFPFKNARVSSSSERDAAPPPPLRRGCTR